MCAESAYFTEQKQKPKKVEKRKLKSKKRICSVVVGKRSGESVESVLKKKMKALVQVLSSISTNQCKVHKQAMHGFQKNVLHIPKQFTG